MTLGRRVVVVSNICGVVGGVVLSWGSRRSTGGFPDVHEVQKSSFGSVFVAVGWGGLVW